MTRRLMSGADSSPPPDRQGGFLGRWSRRKQQAASAPALAEPDAVAEPEVVAPERAGPARHGEPAQDESALVTTQVPGERRESDDHRIPAPADAASSPPQRPEEPQAEERPPLPELHTLTGQSDVSAFLDPEVDESLRRAALRRVFLSPAFNVVDGLDDYDDDFTRFEPLGDIVTADMRHQAQQQAERDEAQPSNEPALEERHRTGKGKHVKSALYESTAFLVGQHMAQSAVTGEAPAPMPERISAWAIYDIFKTADDEMVFVGVVSDSQWHTFCNDFGLAELADDDSLCTNGDRVVARDRIIPVVADLFSQLTKAELLSRLEGSGLPFAPVARPDDLFDDPHLREAGGLLTVSLPDGTSADLPALPLEMDRHKFGVVRDLPAAGEHTAEVLAEIGYDEERVAGLARDGAIALGDKPD